MSGNMIFISYSRQDKDFVDRLTSDLKQAGFNLWRDTESLEAGTVSWERAIRQAIKDSAAVILVASPTALASDYVQGELTISKLQNRPIYPIWAAGENWIDCVPLDMANYQYLDGRAHRYEKSLDALTSSLRSFLDTSEGVMTLGLPTHETIKLNLAQFNYIQDMLNHIYLNYLQYWYEPLSYGTEWLLGNVQTKQLLFLPTMMSVNLYDETEMLRSLRERMKLGYKEIGIEDGSYWAVWDARRIQKALVALHDTNLKTEILMNGGERKLRLLQDSNKLKLLPIKDMSFDQYPIQFVMALFQTSKNNIAYVEL
jgi:hypothetical protein